MSEDFRKLSEYAHARLRNEMYFSSRNPHEQQTIIYKDNNPVLKSITWIPALYTYFREILDNALDEVVGHGHGNKISISYNPKTLELTVEDNGRGIPITMDKTHNTHIATMAVSESRAGRNFGERGSVAGTNGLGAAIVNYTSEYFTLQVKRDGKKFTQEFREGRPNTDQELQISKPIITSSSSDGTGTKVICKPSKYVFEVVPKLKNNMLLPEEFIKSRVYEVALCNPKIKIYYNGEQVKVKPRVEQNLFDNAIVIDIKQGKFTSKFYLVPNFACDGEYVHSIVNNIPAFNGGSHIDAFKRTFYKTLINSLAKESKRRKLTPNNSDIQFNFLVYNITNMEAPNFDSQSKTRLINEEAGTIIRKFLEDEDVYKQIIKKNPSWINEIYERCSDRTQKKDLSDLSKLGKKLLRSKVSRLMDANAKDRSKCILFLAEGESAIAGMSSVRNPEIHGGMGLKGKVLNVFEEHPKKVIENKELSDIMNSVGIMIGQKADRSNMRYSKIYLATDMDHDGSNIQALLVNFFYKYWPELFDPKLEPVIYSFQTPFIIAEKGKERKYWYAHDYNNFKPEDYKGWAITRAKGLGTLTNEDWKHSLHNPVAIPFTEDTNLKETLALLFDSTRADDRKNWMGI